MSSVVISGDTSGTVSLTVPAVAGTNTATLPAATGTVMVSGNQPAFYAYLNAAQNVTTNTWTKVLLDTELFDTNSNFASSRFTPTVAGYYQINSGILPNTSTSFSYAGIYKNGAQYSVIGINSTYASVGVSTLVYLNGSTDYIELYVYFVGTTPQIATSSPYTYMTGCLNRNA